MKCIMLSAMLILGCAQVQEVPLRNGGVAVLPLDQCITFPEPVPVACESSGGRVAIGGSVKAVCHLLTRPEQWLIIDEDGRMMTAVGGGGCFTVVKGQLSQP